MALVVVIGASEGGLAPLQRIIAALPIPCAASVFVVMHSGPHRNLLPSLLSRPGGLPVGLARNGALLRAGHVYLPPPDHHMVLEDNCVRVNRGPKVNYTRPAIDPLFISAAHAHGRQVMGVVLTGGDGDGALGLRAIKVHGGVALVQSPDEAVNRSMPTAAIACDTPLVFPVEKIAERVRAFCLV